MENRIPGSTWIAEGQMVPLLVLCICVITFVIATWLTRRRRLRPIPGMVLLRFLLSQAIEARSRIHLALGSGQIGGCSTIETMAGLTLLDYLAKQSVLCDIPLTVSVADPTTLAAAQGILRRSVEQSEHSDSLPSASVHFIAPDPIAYASGVAHLIERENPALDVLIGTYGPECMLIGEAGARRDVSQVAGTTSPEALALMYPTADETLVGEEIFALGSYLDCPAHLGSLMTEDVLRIITAGLILIGVLFCSLRS